MKIKAYIYILILILPMYLAAGCSSGDGEAEGIDTSRSENTSEYLDDEPLAIGDRVGTPEDGDELPLPRKTWSPSTTRTAAVAVNIEDGLNEYNIPHLWKVTSRKLNFLTSRIEEAHDIENFTTYLYFQRGYLTWYVRDRATKKIYRMKDRPRVARYSAISGKLESDAWESAFLDVNDRRAGLYCFDDATKSWTLYELAAASSLKGISRTMSRNTFQAIERLRIIDSVYAGNPDAEGSIHVEYRYGGKKKISPFHPVIALAYIVTDEDQWREYAAGYSFTKKGTIAIKGLDTGKSYRVILFRPEKTSSLRPGHGDLHWVTGGVEVKNNRFTAPPEVIELAGNEERLEAELSDRRTWDEGRPAAVITSLKARAVKEKRKGFTSHISVEVAFADGTSIEGLKVSLTSPLKNEASLFAGDLVGHECELALEPGGDHRFTGSISAEKLREPGTWQVTGITGTGVKADGTSVDFAFTSSQNGRYLEYYLYREGQSSDFDLLRNTTLHVKEISGVNLDQGDTVGPELVEILEVSGKEESFFHFLIEYDDDNHTDPPGTVTGKIVFTTPGGEDDFEIPVMAADATSAFGRVYAPWGPPEKTEAEDFILPADKSRWFIREIVLWDRLGNTANYIALDLPFYDNFLSLLSLDDEFYFLYNYGIKLPEQTYVPLLSIEVTE